MIRDTVMNSDDFDPLTDLLIGEAVLSLLKSKGPISQQALIGKLQAMQAGEMDSKRRNGVAGRGNGDGKGHRLRPADRRRA